MMKYFLRTQSTKCLSRRKVWVFVRSLLPFVVVCSVLWSTHDAGAKSRVQVGYCSKLTEIDAAKAAGFDYVELRTSEIVALTEPEFETLVARLKQLQFPVPVAYQFIPASIRLTGPNVNKDEQMRYVRTALDRLSRLGTGVIVFGSGPARRVPEGFSQQEALQQLIEFCRRIGPEARARKITIAIEAQRHQETNIINNLQEGLELIKAVNDPNIELIVDFYHLAEEKEDPAIISVARNHIRHLHMANPVGRVFPLSSNEYEYDSFFRNLAKIGYDKRISIEATSNDFPKDAPVAIEFLRRSLTKRS